MICSRIRAQGAPFDNELKINGAVQGRSGPVRYKGIVISARAAFLEPLIEGRRTRRSEAKYR
jgi:hypothetical protein